MYKEPKPMREIHQIQKRFFDEENNISSNERIRRLHKEANEIIKRHGLKIKYSSKVS